MKLSEIPGKIFETLTSVKVWLVILVTWLLWESKVDQYTWLGLILSLTGMREYANIFFAKMSTQIGPQQTGPVNNTVNVVGAPHEPDA